MDLDALRSDQSATSPGEMVTARKKRPLQGLAHHLTMSGKIGLHPSLGVQVAQVTQSSIVINQPGLFQQQVMSPTTTTATCGNSWPPSVSSPARTEETSTKRYKEAREDDGLKEDAIHDMKEEVKEEIREECRKCIKSATQ